MTKLTGLSTETIIKIFFLTVGIMRECGPDILLSFSEAQKLI